MRRSYALFALWSLVIIVTLCLPLVVSYTYEAWFLSTNVPATITAITVETNPASQKDEQLLHFQWKNAAGEDQTAYSGSRYAMDSYNVGDQVTLRLPPGKPQAVTIHSWLNLIGGPLVYLAIWLGSIYLLIRTHKNKNPYWM